MKKIIILLCLFSLLNQNVIASKKIKTTNKKIEKINYLESIPIELLYLILQNTNNARLALVNKKFYSLIENFDWYSNKKQNNFNKICNNTIKAIITYLYYLDHKNYAKINTPAFLEKKFIKKCTSEKIMMLMRIYFYYLENLYPRFCPTVLFNKPTENYNNSPSIQHINTDYFKKKTYKYIEIYTYHIAYVKLKFSQGIVVGVETKCPHDFIGTFFNKLTKKIKNIIRIFFKNNVIDFSKIIVKKKTIRILNKNQTIIHDGNNKTPYSNFYSIDTIINNKNTLALHKTQYDFFFWFPLFWAIKEKKINYIEELYKKKAWFSDMLDSMLFSHGQEKIARNIEKTIKENENQDTPLLLLLSFPTDEQLKNIFIHHHKNNQ